MSSFLGGEGFVRTIAGDALPATFIRTSLDDRFVGFWATDFEARRLLDWILGDLREVLRG